MLPSDSPFFLTETLTKYVRERFWWILARKLEENPARVVIGELKSKLPIFDQESPGPIPPLNLSSQLVVDCEQMVTGAAEAYCTRVELKDFDAQRYDMKLPKKPTGQHPGKEALWIVEDEYDGGTLLTKPSIVVDMHGRIIVWFLPYALSRERQRILWEAALKMDDSLRGSLAPNSGKKHWRTNPQNYKLAGECRPHPGNISLSPAWFQQGRDAPQFKPEISRTLKPRSENISTLGWLEETAESFALMGALLSIVHPELYEIGREVLKKLADKPEMVKDGEDVMDVLRLWTTPFSAYSLISNCTTPLHRDNHSQGPWYDCLTTIGEYGPGGRLKLTNIGLELDYPSGTMVFLLGRLVRHGTSEITGNRVCIAQYMRDNVHERMGVRSTDWPTVTNTFASLPLC